MLYHQHFGCQKVTDPHFIFRSEVFMSFIRTRGMPAGMSQEKEFQGIQYSLLREVLNFSDVFDGQPEGWGVCPKYCTPCFFI